MNKVRLLGARVLVQRDEAEAVTAGGIIIPEDAQARPEQGTVLAVGPAVKDIVVGDVVLFGTYCGSETDYGTLITEDDVLGVVK